jgi:hypothetical protein
VRAGVLPAGADPRLSAPLRAFSTDAAAVSALAAHAGTRVLELVNPVPAFCRFEDAGASRAFASALDSALTADVWFCAPIRGAPAGAPRRNCTVGFPRPAPLPADADCDALVASGRDWTDAYGDALLGVKKLI